MSTRLFLATALLASVIAMPALAGHCPADVKALDHALSKMSMTATEMSEVKKLRDKGQALHKSGNHKKSQKVLARAMRMVLNSQ